MNRTDGYGQNLTSRHWSNGRSAWVLFIICALLFIGSECGETDVDSTVKEGRMIPERENVELAVSELEYEEGVELFIAGTRVTLSLPGNLGVTETDDYILYRRKWDEGGTLIASKTSPAKLDSQKEDTLNSLRMTILNQLVSLAEGFNRELLTKNLQEICRVVADADSSGNSCFFEGEGKVVIFFEDDAGGLELRWEDNLLSLKVDDYDEGTTEVYGLNEAHEWVKIPESVVGRLRKIREKTEDIP